MLTDVACRKAGPKDKAQKLSDSLGLYLFVTPAGFKSWRMKYRIGTIEKRLVLGAYPEMSLKEARDRRDEARRKIRDGLDPAVERKKEKAAQSAGSARTVQRFSEDWHASRISGWRPHYAKAVLSRLKKDVFPTIGSVPIGDVTAPMVLEMLQRIERRGSLDVVRRVAPPRGCRGGGAGCVPPAPIAAHAALLQRIRMTPLDLITDCRFDRSRQWVARLAICRFVSGRPESSHPAWRIGSNAPLGSITPDDWAAFEDEPCQFCGAPGTDIRGGSAGGVGMEYCPSCGNEWVVGDYDWRKLSDCLQYREDLAAGLIAPDSI